ncbi:hypothetical protein JIM95_011205 [Corynebacterium sp. CCM 8835]|uniref:Uncharacterized protein n=1 Tax=Corynebacterium antarcticum TaxID=2800405 RepID=A0A9Q4GNR4_9CORY|nr:hypothetical protein [Corynebacterium antarcticum]MCL0246692.1 hypothetical protein [Corynebacterium antarcticum]MCX7539111.1 hypothetical protein [Corynebacterium antarcticum]
MNIRGAAAQPAAPAVAPTVDATAPPARFHGTPAGSSLPTTTVSSGGELP